MCMYKQWPASAIGAAREALCAAELLHKAAACQFNLSPLCFSQYRSSADTQKSNVPGAHISLLRLPQAQGRRPQLLLLLLLPLFCASFPPSEICLAESERVKSRSEAVLLAGCWRWQLSSLMGKLNGGDPLLSSATKKHSDKQKKESALNYNAK